MGPKGFTPEVSFGNFPCDLKAKELADFLEAKVGLVRRCKVKRVSGILPPHAFVHFESAEAANKAFKKADKGRLILRGEWKLKAHIDDREWGVAGLRDRQCRSRIISKVNDHIEMVDVLVELGSITGTRSMLVSCTESKIGRKRGPIFRIEPEKRRLRLFFNVPLKVDGFEGRLCHGSEGRLCDVMLEIRLSDIRQVQEVEREIDPVLMLQLSNPPSIFFRTADDDVYEYDKDPSTLADDGDPWIRSLDTVISNKSIGKCLDYKLTVSPRQRTQFKKAIAYFRDHDVLQKDIQAAYNVVREAPKRLSESSLFFSVPNLPSTLPFDIMFLVNALVHHGIVHTTNLSAAFYHLLQPTVTPLIVSTFALRQLLMHRAPLHDAAEELKAVIGWARNENTIAKTPKLTGENVLVRRVVITPTRALCLPPEVELSNRVIRHFGHLADRFLRVSFLDENGLSIPSASLSVQVAPIVREVSPVGTYSRTAVYKRIASIMMEGFSICGRRYCFLAFSAGQLRDCSAWFFASDGKVGVWEIRDWMGRFPSGNVAKHAARMGQCFSATYSTLEVLKTEVCNLPDIKKNNYDFSDGCGKISPSFASLVAEMLKLENPPSAYQIRYAGYKGVVAVWDIARTGKQTFKLGLRDSMLKFHSSHCKLEIVGWSKFLPCFLNRQIITLLSTLNVKDSIFMEMQETMVQTLDRMVNDRSLAYSFLMQTCSGELYGAALRMLCAGFDPRTEAHLKAMLVAIRAGQLDELVQKSKIFVPKGRLLMGCLDETAKLQYGQCFVRASDPPNGEAGCHQRRSVVITGTVIMTKNPCMHPGDIRVLEAVDVPDLHHLVDCLVVPQNGPRPHPNEASGSDLDGDVYFVSWDENLLPPSRKSSDPMEYVAHAARVMQGDVKTEHVVEFFCKHMVNDTLGKICNAHVVHADRSQLGSLDDNCLLLAELAARAVDYPKTGKPAVMPFYLKPKLYPDFMEKDQRVSYESRKIIGQLYRKVQGILPKENERLQLELASSTFQVPDPRYDPDLEFDGYEQYLGEAWVTKQAYDKRLLAIMSHFSIKDEAEVVTGHVVLSRKTSSRTLGDVKERVKCAYLDLRKEFISLLDDATGDEVDQVLGGSLNDVQLAKVSAWYHGTYHTNWIHRTQAGSNMDVKRRPLLSFPWVPVEQLVSIKNSKC